MRLKLNDTQLNIIRDIISNGNVTIDYSVKCDLCGHLFDAVHVYPSRKAKCPKCDNYVHTGVFDDVPPDVP